MKCSMSKGLLMTALITGSVMWGGTSVFAEELQEYTLDQMVVTATRTEMKELDVPATVNVVTADDIQKTGSTTVSELLVKTLGVTDYSYSADGEDFGSSQSRIYLRGMDKGALVMVNGAPINLMNYASLSNIPVKAVEKIEVVKGANSVLYGAEAQGGVINIITKKGGTPKTSASVAAGNYLKKWDMTTQGDGYIVSLGRDYKHDDDGAQMPMTSKGTQRYTYKSTREYGFLSAQLAKDLTFTYSGQKSNPWYKTNKIGTNIQTGYAYRYEDRKQALSLIYDNKEDGYKATLAYNEKKVESDKLDASGKVIEHSPTSNYTASNIYFDNQKTFKVGDDSLVVGVDYKHEKYDLKYGEVPKSAYNASRDGYGLYASYNKKFNDKFNAILGVRGQYYASTDFEDSHKVFLPQLQTNYKLDDKTSWYTNIGKAFELSAINAINGTKGAGNISAVKGHTPKPQEGWSYETGIKHISDTISHKLAVFHMDFKNKFAWEQLPSGEYIQINKGKFKSSGVEYEFSKLLSDQWSYRLGATFQDPKSKESSKWTQESARLMFNAGVDYTVGKLNANLTGLYVGNREYSKYKYDGSSAGKNPDHRLQDRIVLNTSFNYKADDRNQVILNLNNLLDRREPLAVYEYRALPFNWMLTYQYTF